MPNNYFRFKQFTVVQDKCAMKVCTDACIFGSMLPLISKNYNVNHVLDIGTGTGLLSLMYAQQSNAEIQAVEIDEAAAMQARLNFSQSPWKQRLKIIKGDITNLQLPRKYDLIIANPPFYENDLKSNNSLRNVAMHGTTLTLQKLLHSIKINIAPEGIFSVLLPSHRAAHFQQTAQSLQFYPAVEIKISQTPANHYFRSILLFAKKEMPFNGYKLIIQNEKGAYTHKLKELMKDYYLHL